MINKIGNDQKNDIINFVEEQSNVLAFFLIDSLTKFPCGEFDRLEFAFLLYDIDGINDEQEKAMKNKIASNFLSDSYFIHLENMLRTPLTYQMRIVREEQLIFCRNEVAFADYKEQLIRRYCDLEPDLEVFKRDYDIGLRREFLGR